MRWTKSIVAFCGLFLFLGSAVWGLSDEEFERRFLALSDALRCPTCQGLSVKDSEAGFSEHMKQKIEEMIRAGKTDDEVKAFFVDRYGQWILREPPKTGFNLLLWVLPGAGLVLGLVLVLRRSRQWVKEPEAELPEEESLTPEEQARINKDLERFENS